MWWKILQALLIGIIIGLALHVGLSMLIRAQELALPGSGATEQRGSGVDSASLFGTCDGRCSGHF